MNQIPDVSKTPKFHLRPFHNAPYLVAPVSLPVLSYTDTDL